MSATQSLLSAKRSNYLKDCLAREQGESMQSAIRDTNSKAQRVFIEIHLDCIPALILTAIGPFGNHSFDKEPNTYYVLNI